MYTMYIIWSKMMLDWWQKSLKCSFSQGLFALRVFWYFAKDVPRLACSEFCFWRISSANSWGRMLHWQPCHIHCLQSSSSCSSVWTLCHLLKSYFWGRGIPGSLYFYQLWAHWWCDLWYTSKVYLSTKAFPIFILCLYTTPGLYTICLHIRLSAT